MQSRGPRKNQKLVIFSKNSKKYTVRYVTLAGVLYFFTLLVHIFHKYCQITQSLSTKDREEKIFHSAEVF